MIGPAVNSSRCVLALVVAALLAAPTAAPAASMPSAGGAAAPSAPEAQSGAISPRTLHELLTAPAASLDARAARTRRAALRVGLRDLDAAARALLLTPEAGTSLERARAAVLLAPDLPAARAALARARLAQGDYGGALSEAVAALAAMPRDLDAFLWLGATAASLLVWSLAGAALLFIAFLGFAASRHAAHDLGDALHAATPAFARAALLLALALVPLALGEGALGLGVFLFGAAFCYGDRRQRLALLLAAGVTVLALHPLAEFAGRLLAAPGADPIAEAAYAAENGIATPLELARLRRAAARDPLAEGALALEARRAGDLARADALYRSLIDAGHATPDVLNNAGNVRLARGDVHGAIELYQRAVKGSSSAVPWFNLAQAYGRRADVDNHDRALERAQAIDDDEVRELADILDSSPGGYVADLSLDPATVAARLLRTADAGPVAAALRRPVAPGALGGSPAATGAAFLGAALLALGLRRLFRPSATCPRCGTRVCPRCPTAPAPDGLCPGCARLLHRPETAEPTLRAARFEALRRRSRRVERVSRVSALLMPGSAGLLSGRPLLGLTALVLFAVALAGFLGREGLVVDPLAVGAAGPWALSLAAAASALLYVGVTFVAFVWRRS